MRIMIHEINQKIKRLDNVSTNIVRCVCTNRGGNMEKRKSKVNFLKAGNGVGSKITLPISWLREMNVTKEEREIELFFDREKKEIIIKKLIE